MRIIVNGKEKMIEKKPILVSELLEVCKVEQPDMVSVQLNGEFVKKENFQITELKNEDEIEFLYFMGGGEITDLGPIIREHSFFKDLKQEYLDFIVGCASNVRFKAGETIFKEGEPAELFYLIRSGLVAVDILAGAYHKVTVQTIKEGDILGWAWLIPPYRARFNSRAVEDTRAIALDGKCLREKCEKNPDLGYELLKRLTKVFTQRLEATRIQLLSLYEGGGR